MSASELAVVAGVVIIAVGGLAGGVRRWARLSASVQAAGMAVLGVGAVAIAASDATAGGGFTSGPDPTLGVDRLSAIFLATLVMVAVPALVYEVPYLARTASRRPVTMLTAGFLLAMILVLTARDVTTFLAGWELMTLLPASAILVTGGTDPTVRRAVFVYLAVTHVGGVGTWMAMLTLAQHGAVRDGSAEVALLSPALTAFVAVAALVGFATKAGLMPLHTWLPRAHPVAPTHLSALMSGVMVKVALYGLIRVLFQWLGPLPLWVGIAVLALGLLSAVGGVLYALFDDDLKRLLAFSSIENVGIIALALGAALMLRARGAYPWADIALGAALLHTVNHAAIKGLLFLGAGVFERGAGTRRLDGLGGLLRRMPWTGGAFLVGCLAIAGVPPLNGFASEWLTLQALVQLTFDQPVGIALAGAVALAGLAATAALGVFCFVKVAGLVLLGPPRTPVASNAMDAEPAMRVGVVGLAATAVGLALVPGVLLPALADSVGGDAGLEVEPGIEVPGTGGLPAPALMVALIALVLLVGLVRGGRRAAPGPVWACGQRRVPALDWTSAGFAKPLRLVLESVLRPEREIVRTRTGGVLQRVRYRGSVPHLFDTYLYAPLVRVALRGAGVVRRLQSGSVRAYAAYMLGVFVFVLLLARWGVFG